MKVLVLFVVLTCYRSVASQTIVVPTTTEESHEESQDTNRTVEKPQMYYFHVESDVKYRYARTLVSTRIANPADVAQEVYFSAVLPETAFISKFNMEVDGKVYDAYVKEKEEAKQEYDKAVQQGQTAAHVALTARDSNRFTVSVNVEPNKKVTFNLTYEELLNRRLKTYRDVINLDPGQIVPDFSVVVRIEESSNITSLNVPALKVNNEIKSSPDANAPNPLATVERPTPTTAVVKYAPTPEQQKELAKDGLKGQFIVEYDVDRTSNPGEILVNDGYFVHFFSPADLTPLKKQVTFVLDVSGSMSGRKIEQLRQAMAAILGDLNKGDLFSIVLFSQTAQVWDPTISDEEMDKRLEEVGRYYPVKEEHQPPKITPSVIVKVTPENISKAKAFIDKLNALAATAIYDGLMMALEISQLEPNETENHETEDQKPEPIIVFLTDGLPNVRVSDSDTIISDVTKGNTKKSSIFSLALGNDADFDFLKKLSLRNSGFARKIYEAADTALQLTDFYQEIASPLLANVTFDYAPEEVENGTVTKNTFRRLFAGSELVVAGKLREDANITGDVEASSVAGRTEFKFRPIIIPYPPIILPPHEHNVTNHTPSSMERMWAYLTIKQLLDEDAAKDYDHNDNNQTSPEKRRALELALQYSFVTPLTSLVVVKPNESKAVDTQDASQSHPFGSVNRGGGGYGGGVHYLSASIPLPMAPGNAFRPLTTTFMPRPVMTDFPETQPSSAEPSSTTQSTRCLAKLDDVTWLASNHTITLPNGNEVLEVAGTNETNTEFSSCTTPTGEAGHCRHLQYCVLNTFTANLDDFIPYVCHIESYVGVCCPDIPVPDC